MADAQTLPYIDLGADTETLRKYAQEYLGRKISEKAKDETVRDRFAAIYEEETGVKLAPVEPLDDDPADEPDEHDEEQAAGQAPPKPIAATIIVQDNPLDPQPITGGCNFVSYRIERNKEVRVPMHIIETLRNAKQTLYDPKTMAPKEVLAYPFSIIKLHYPGE